MAETKSTAQFLMMRNSPGFKILTRILCGIRIKALLFSRKHSSLAQARNQYGKTEMAVSNLVAGIKETNDTIASFVVAILRKRN